MNRLHFDCYSGAAGDMLLCALLDLGLDPAELVAELRRLLPELTELAAEPTRSGGLAARKLVLREAESDHSESAHHDHHHHQSHHEHHHSGHHHHPAEPAPARAHHHHHHAGRGRHLRDLLDLLAQSRFAPAVRERAESIFRCLAQAEGQVHGRAPEEIHFHEISGVDTFVDVTGVCWALDRLAPGRVTSSPVAAGSGTVECAHGVLPVPAPATLAILTARGIPLAPAPDGIGELLTPTGAAILAEMVDEFGPFPAGAPLRIGHGAGTRQTPGRANVVRATLLAAEIPAESETDEVVEFRTALDDLTPEQLAFLGERAFAAGALEFYALPAVMKKGRPGWEIVALTGPDGAAPLADCLFRNGSTFGLRQTRLARLRLDRRQEEVDVSGHAVGVKLGYRNGRLTAVKPEYEDCRRAALALDLDLREIQRRAVQAARDRGWNVEPSAE